MRRLIISLFSLSLVLLFAGNLRAYDTPHSLDWTTVSSKKVGCSTSCHVPKVYLASGPSLTTQANNYDLCIFCHNSLGLPAANLPFDNNDQAVQANEKGTSHRWDKYLPASDGFNNAYGLRSAGSLQNASLKYAALKFKHADGRGGVTCSTCHNQHYQSTNPWDPAGGFYTSPGASAGGTKTSITQTGAGWATDQWKDFYVRITSGSCKGYVRLIKSNTNETLVIYATGISTDPSVKRLSFPIAIAAGNTYIIISAENHFMRMANKASEMCENCHYYRTPDSKPGGSIAQTNVETCNPNAGDGGRCYKMSHPIRKNLTTDVSNANQFVGAAPLEPLSVFDANGHIITQTGLLRYAGNGGADTNPTNNMVLDENSKVRCMSCHGIHYTDSDSTTIDEPQP